MSSVQIQLDDKYQIGSDRYQWILKKKKMVNGEVEYRPFAFFQRLDELLDAYVWGMARESGAKSAYELRKALDDAIVDITRVTQQLVTLVEAEISPKARITPPRKKKTRLPFDADQEYSGECP